MSSAGALLGIFLGAGVLLTLAGLLALRPPRLADRLMRPSMRMAPTSLGPLGSLIEISRPFIDALSRVLGRDSDRSVTLARQLRRAGRSADISRYRLEQVIWAAGGMLIGAAVIVVASARGQLPGPFLSLLILVLAGFVGVLLNGRKLASEVRRRGQRMSDQLPAAAELLAFAVSAGESPIAALDRVSTHMSGDLADDLSDVVRSVRSGTPMVAALRGLGDISPSGEVARFVDGIAIATERGTPMAEVLRAQAADARAAARRQLLESAGRKEILMLVPVVFFILPIVVVIALFPGIHGLNLTVP